MSKQKESWGLGRGLERRGPQSSDQARLHGGAEDDRGLGGGAEDGDGGVGGWWLREPQVLADHNR